jgi:hypothetical protein
MEIFHRYGLWGAFRISHVLVAVMWMGLLWFFNFVQTPAYAELDPAARNQAFDKLTWRALWWFRWAAAATILFGVLILLVGGFGETDVYRGDFWMHSSSGPILFIGIVMGIVMFLNVWLVIWPQQQIVIANARNLLAGGEADPNAAAAARAGAMASRQNTIFSIPVLVFMVGTVHFWNGPNSFAIAGGFNELSSGKAIIFMLLGLILIGVLEANALGYISGRGNTGLNMIYETHRNAMIAGFAIVAGLYILSEIILRR